MFSNLNQSRNLLSAYWRPSVCLKKFELLGGYQLVASCQWQGQAPDAGLDGVCPREIGSTLSPRLLQFLIFNQRICLVMSGISESLNSFDIDPIY